MANHRFGVIIKHTVDHIVATHLKNLTSSISCLELFVNALIVYRCLVAELVEFKLFSSFCYLIMAVTYL